MKENAETLNNNALHLIKKGNVDDAIELLKRAVTIEPENQTIWFNLGITLRDDGNFEEARHALETAHMLDPDNTEIIDTLAITCMNGEDMDAALSYCAEGLEKNELDAHLWNTFGVLYFNKNELDLAAEARNNAESVLLRRIVQPSRHIRGNGQRSRNERMHGADEEHQAEYFGERRMI